METMNQARIYVTAACVAVLAAAGCSGLGTGGTNSTAALPAQNAMRDGLGSSAGSRISEYVIPRDSSRRLPKTFPVGISLGPDGAMWFTERGLGKFGSITTNGTFVASVKLTGQARFPQNLVTGPDGNLWAPAGSTRTYFQESSGLPDPYGAVQTMTPAGALVHVTQLPKNSDPRAITLGPDGNLWFTARAGFIGRITPGFKFDMFKIPQNNGAFGITVGPDSNLWFCETNDSAIGRITTWGKNKITIFPFAENAGCSGVTSANGYLWATEFRTAKVAQLTTDGTIVDEIPLPKDSSPKGIAVGSNGKLYVAEFGTGKIAEVSLTRRVLIREFDIPTPNSGPWGIAAGPDGNIWFAESLIGKIGKLNL